jgi:AcrR family transcriptional regulator
MPEETVERAALARPETSADASMADVTTSRLDRRKARTRASLVAAARTLLASRDPAEISIQEVTDAADVGFGSFYNHFHSKQDLFDAAVEEVLEEHGTMLDAAMAGIADPAEVFAAAVRMTARLPKTQPQLARILRRIGYDLVAAPHGLSPRARRDLQEARATGRFTVDDVDVALACVAGALLGVLHMASINTTPAAIDRAADELAANLLRMLGVPADEAACIAHRQLPEAAQLERFGRPGRGAHAAGSLPRRSRAPRRTPPTRPAGGASCESDAAISIGGIDRATR